MSQKIIKADLNTNKHRIYHLLLWSVAEVGGVWKRQCFDNGYESAQLFFLPYFSEGNVSPAIFDVRFDLKPNASAAFGSALQVCAPRGTRKSFVTKKLYNSQRRNPPNTTTKPYEFSVRKFWRHQAHCRHATAERVRSLIVHCWGEDTSCIFCSGRLLFSPSCA